MSTKISELRVGDTVAISQRSRALCSSPPYSLDWVVTKITPSGQVVVQKKRNGANTLTERFNKHGVDMGGRTTWAMNTLEPDHLKAVREVHLWQLLDDVRKALYALRKELNTSVMPATYLDHTNFNAKLAELRETYGKAIWEARKQGALQ